MNPTAVQPAYPLLGSIQEAFGAISLALAVLEDKLVPVLLPGAPPELPAPEAAGPYKTALDVVLDELTDVASRISDLHGRVSL